MPCLVAYVYLVHHSVPLAACHHLVVVAAQQRVTFKAFLRPVCPKVCLHVAYGDKMTVHCNGIIQVVEICHCLHREEYYLLVGITAVFIEHEVYAQRLCLKGHELIADPLPFSIIRAVCILVEHLGGNPCSIFAVAVEHSGGFSRMTGGKLAAKVSRIFHQIVGIETVGIPCHVHKKLCRELCRLDVAHVDYPHTVYAASVCNVHLMPHMLYLHLLEPFHCPWRTVVAEMVVHSEPSLAVACVGSGNLAYVAPVVIA